MQATNQKKFSGPLSQSLSGAHTLTKKPEDSEYQTRLIDLIVLKKMHASFSNNYQCILNGSHSSTKGCPSKRHLSNVSYSGYKCLNKKTTHGNYLLGHVFPIKYL